MTKYQKELLVKCDGVNITQELPLFDDIYILPTEKKHDSGFKIMYVVGKVRENEQYYLLDTYCDVINLGFLIKTIKEVNIDIEHHGIIHLWSNYQLFKSGYRVSSCTFEFVDREVLDD